MAYNNWCSGVSGSTAENLVATAHDKFTDLGKQTYDLAVNNLTGAWPVSLSPLPVNVSFDFDGELAAFNRPVRPALDAAAFDFRAPGSAPGAPPVYTVNPLTFDEAPIDPGLVAPTLNYGPRPDAPLVSVPVAPPDPAALVFPVEPGYTMPDVPSIESLNLPAAPDLDIPEFTGTSPVFQEPALNETWDFTPGEYVGTLKDALVAAINPMLQAKPALPEHIEDAIFQKGRSRIEIETGRAVEQAYTEFAARGFDMPQGMLNGTVLELRQKGQDQIAEFNRDAVVKQYEETLQNLRFAITNGAALEGTLIQLFIEGQRFELQAAQFQRDSTVALLNARISAFNARLQGYQTDAQVFEARIRATLSRVEVYRAQIEGERARGEINVQKIQLYEGMLRGVQVLADFYRTRVQVVQTQADVQRSVIDRYKAQVDAYDSRWRAFATEMQGYTANVEAEGKRVDVYRTLVDAQFKKVDAWSTKGNLQLGAERLNIEQAGQRLAAWRAQVERYGADLGAERARLAAVSSLAGAQTQMYTAESNVESAASAATDRSFELGLSKARADVDAQLQKAQMQISQAMQMLTQAVEIARSKSQIASQLAASTMSAVNYGASISSGQTSSKSCGSNFNFQGEIGDA